MKSCYYVLCNNEFVLKIFKNRKEAEEWFNSISGDSLRGSEYVLYKQTEKNLIELANKYFIDVYIEDRLLNSYYNKKIEVKREDLTREKIKNIVSSFYRDKIKKNYGMYIIQSVSYILEGKKCSFIDKTITCY